MVGIDGGFVRDWHDKANHFEVVVGKSVPEDRDDRYFGFVQNHDTKPKRRLFEVLQGQGLQMNQELTFLTDGGDSVRELASDVTLRRAHPRLVPPRHAADRARPVRQGPEAPRPRAGGGSDAASSRRSNGTMERQRPRGPVPGRWLADDLDALESDYPGLKRFARLAGEFHTYIANNAGAIPNYAERWRYGERSRRPSSSPRSTSSSASASPSGSRCSGRREARTCCCRPGRGRSTAPSGRRSPDGTPARCQREDGSTPAAAA